MEMIMGNGIYFMILIVLATTCLLVTATGFVVIFLLKRWRQRQIKTRPIRAKRRGEWDSFRPY